MGGNSDGRRPPPSGPDRGGVGRGRDRNGHGPAIAAAGGVEALVSYAARHIGSVRVQRSALSALRNLCLTGGGAEESSSDGGGTSDGVGVRSGSRSNGAVMEAASRSGAVDAIVAAMALYESDAAVQAGGCGALGALTAYCDGGGDTAVGGETAPKAGEGPLLTATMPNASATVRIRASVRASGGILALAEALRAHPADPAVAEAALGAICNLSRVGLDDAEDNEDGDGRLTRAAIAEAGCVLLTVSAIRLHGRSPAVLERGCRILCHLIEGDIGSWGGMTPSPSDQDSIIEVLRVEEPESVLWDVASRYPERCGEWCRRVLERL